MLVTINKAARACLSGYLVGVRWNPGLFCEESWSYRILTTCDMVYQQARDTDIAYSLFTGKILMSLIIVTSLLFHKLCLSSSPGICPGKVPSIISRHCH